MVENAELTSDVCEQLWTSLVSRLHDGEAMWTNQDFVEALESAYVEVVGQEVAEGTRREIARMVTVVNREHPGTFRIQGVQNGIVRAFEDAARRLNWDVATLQSRGVRALRRFSQRDGVRDLLDELDLRPDQVNFVECVQNVISDLSAPQQPPKTRKPAAPPRPTPTPAPEPAAKPPADAQPSPSAAAEAQTQALIDSGEVDEREAQRQLKRAEQRRSELEDNELKKVPGRLDSYVAQGVVTTDEAGKLRELHALEERLKNGEVDAKEATEIRNSIMNAGARDSLERKVKDVVSDSVRYLQVFESMKKTGHQYFDALTFLIEHKAAVVSADDSGIDLGPSLAALIDDMELADRLFELMERKDQEIRMLCVRLPPYSAIDRGVARIDNMVIEETFINDLEGLDVDGMAERLNSPDKVVRVRPAADMLCFISLIDHLTKKTRFRKEMRLLRISRQIEQFYERTSDLGEARHQAESFINRKLRRLFPDMDSDETAELKQRSTQMVEQIENRILEERQAALEEKRKRTEAAAAPAKSDASGGGDDELSEEEILRGVQIGRVEMRVGGNMRPVPRKIMPDPEDPERTVLSVRDPDTGELVPAKRRDTVRYVERGRDGIWRETRGG